MCFQNCCNSAAAAAGSTSTGSSNKGAATAAGFAVASVVAAAGSAWHGSTDGVWLPLGFSTTPAVAAGGGGSAAAGNLLLVLVLVLVLGVAGSKAMLRMPSGSAGSDTLQGQPRRHEAQQRKQVTTVGSAVNSTVSVYLYECVNNKRHMVLCSSTGHSSSSSSNSKAAPLSASGPC
jgi:hypothetical protein